MRSHWTMCIRGAALLLLIFALTGCGTLPAGRFQAFRASSEDITAKTSDTYTRIEKRQRDFVVLTAPDRSLTTETFKPVNSSGESFDIRPTLQKREEALDVLVKYAKALESLAGKDFATDLDKSAQDLAGSLRALGGGSEGAGVSNAFGTVTDLLSRQVTDWMRKDALKKTMDLGQPGVDALTRLLSQSNKKIELFTAQMRNRYIAHAQAGRPAFGTWARYKFDLEVAEVMEEFEEINSALESASSALDKIPQAHREIRTSLENREQPLEALQQMVHEVRHLQGFYRALPTK